MSSRAGPRPDAAARARRLSPWLWRGGLGLLAVAVPLVAHSQGVEEPDRATWIVDPKVPGADAPPAGRSLFDHLFLAATPQGRQLRLPFPFAALVRAIRREVAPGDASIRSVLIPLGRSLQRTAAAPDFFRFPRIVVAVTGAPRAASGMLLKDRLYLGYQEKAGVLEVISYNEAAARFEFQVVRDYRAGGSPKAFYARRKVCVACHQNAAPLFARPLWDETNANTAIAARLAAVAPAFHGVPVQAGVETPYAIDAATERSNAFAATQLLWREGCGGSAAAAVHCRAAAVELALELMLGGNQGIDIVSDAYLTVLAPAIDAHWRSAWPHGLKVPNPDVPNRIPLREAAADPATLAHVAAAFEPLAPRPPLEIWHADTRAGARLVAGLAEFIGANDMRRLDERLRRVEAPRIVQRAACTMTDRREGSTRRIGFRCGSTGGSLRLAGRIYARGARITHGDIDRLAAAAGHEAVGLTVAGGSLQRDARGWRARLDVRRDAVRARTSRGRAIDSIALRWSDNAGVGANAEVVIRDDFPFVTRAVRAVAQRTLDGKTDAFLPQSFQRARILRVIFDELGIVARDWCCLDVSGMPPANVGESEHPFPADAGPSLPAIVQDFLRYCGACHRSGDAFPPNYLHGDGKEIMARLAQCAPRIVYRLKMWRLAPADRGKTPMPPVQALTTLGRTEVQWRDGAELARLEAHALRLAGDLPAGGNYESLRPCLDPASASAAR